MEIDAWNSLDAWKNSKTLTRLSIICLLISFKKATSVQADPKHASYHSEIVPSLASSLSDATLSQAHTDLNPAALLDPVPSLEALSRWRRSPAGLLDLSAAASGGGYGGYGGGGGYGYNQCDCRGFDLIGLIAGGAALAAVATFLINQLMMNNGGGRRAFGLGLLPDGLAEMLAGVLPQPTEMFALKAVNRTCDVISDLERSQISVVESRDGGSGRSDCECFPGLAGALAGFAALGALIAFAVAQAIAANNGGGRSISPPADSEEFAPSGLALAGAMLALLVVDDASCLPHQLCQLNSRARRAGYPYSYVVRVASLPLSWVLMKTTGEPMTNLCTGATSLAADGHNCDVTFSRCAF